MVRNIPQALGFVRGSLEASVSAYYDWSGRSLLKKWRRAEGVVESFKEVNGMFPLTSGPLTKVAFMQLERGWTLVLGNQASQQGVTSVVANIVRQSRNDGIHLIMRSNPNASIPRCCPRSVYAESVFEYYKWKGPDLDVMSRSLSLTYGTEWDFDSWGDPLPFEKLEAYKNECIPARFSRPVVVSLLRQFNVDLDDPRFFFNPSAHLMVLPY